MADNIAGQWGGGWNNFWLVWIAFIALLIFLFCGCGFNFC